MNHTLDISSLAVSKLNNSLDNFIKYDIDVSLDEVENNENGIKLKYKIVLLSNPTNTKLATEGFVSLFGNEIDISKQLAPDQNNIPLIVNVVYQDIFPLLYIICKTMQIPCPAYKLTHIDSTIPKPAPEEPKAEPIETMTEKIEPENEISIEKTELAPEVTAEPVIEEANVSTV